MTDVQERRDPKAQRKPVATLVEVCGNVPGVPVFEAESVDVSARGMHLRTAYLPESGTPLVCRFESEGREIVVEGTVAWRREAARGGEFGVLFTALDSRSVDTLRGLCAVEATPPDPKTPSVGEPGARVRLHIDGLGSPMKARVKTGNSSKVQVGSSLEFLKVGRRLELEDLDMGARRAAEIDGVSVVVDPSTQIPQLVVALRFEGAEEQTPSPSVAEVGTHEPAKPGLRIPASAVTTDAALPSAKTASRVERAPETKSGATKVSADASVTSPTASSDDSDDDEAPEMRGRVAAMAASAEKKVQVASEHLARATTQAGAGARNLFRGAAAKLLALRGERSAPPRRTTSPAPVAQSPEKHKLRPQSGAAQDAVSGASRSPKRALAIGVAGSVVAVCVLAFALRGESAPPPGAQARDNATATVGDAVPATANSAVTAANARSGSNGPVTANVPLFGPTSLATTEPAPLGPPPGTEAALVEQNEKEAAQGSVGASRDESFSDGEEEPSRTRSSDKPREREASAATKPEDVSPWGHGKMHEPVIHRLRLDAPGAKLEGSVEPTGFTIVVPSRKVMEAAAGIAKRDERIARVKASNTGSGAQISFRFKDGVPSYRVRLRRDFVEFLISEPTKASKAEAKPRKKS